MYGILSNKKEEHKNIYSELKDEDRSYPTMNKI